MKSIIDSNQFFIPIHNNLIKQNNKSFFFQNKTIDSSSKERKINKNDFTKNKIKKSIIINEKKNKEKKSKSNSLNKDKIINKNLLKFPESISMENNLLTNKNISSFKLNTKIYEKVIDKLFHYLKDILPLELYKKIKNQFISDIKQEIININQEIKILNGKEYNSSITNLIKKTINNLYKNDNISNKISSSNKIIKNEKQKISSLYSLKKGYKTYCKTANNSRSKSKETSCSISKGNENNNIISSRIPNKEKKKRNSKYPLISNKKMLNSKLLEKLKNDYFIDIGNNTMRNKNPQNKNKIKNSIDNLKSVHNRNIKVSNISGIIGSISQTTSNSMSKKNNKNKLSNFLNLSKIIKKKNNHSINNSNKIYIVKDKKIKNIEYNNNEIKNLEQLKVIKSTLDDNLKVMFNFSYECFLNKESDSQSKKSVEDTINNNENIIITNNNNKNNN